MSGTLSLQGRVLAGPGAILAASLAALPLGMMVSCTGPTHRPLDEASASRDAAEFWASARDVGPSTLAKGGALGAPGAPAAPVEGALDLSMAIALASQSALSIEAAHQRTVAGEEGLRAARKAAWPTVELGARFDSWDGIAQATAGNFVDVNRQSLTLAPALRLVFEPGPALYGARRAAAELDALEGNEASAMLAAMGDGAQRWCDWALACGQENVATSAVVQGEAFVQDALVRLEGGAGLQLDVERARARLAAATRFQIQAQAARKIAGLRLAEILRLDPANLHSRLAPGRMQLADLDSVESTEVPIEQRSADELVQSAILRHPALRSAAATDVALRTSQAEATDAWKLPRVEIFAQHGAFGEDLDALHEQERLAAAVIWAWHPALPARARAARAQRRAARAEAQAMALGIETEVRRALASAEAAQATRTAAAAELTAARAAHRLALEQLDAGSALTLDVLDAELILRNAELAALVADIELARSRAAIHIATGRTDFAR